MSDKLKEISDKCDELQTETGEAIGTVTGEPGAEVLAKVLQREKKRTLLVRKHEQCTALRSEYAKETQALLKQIEDLKVGAPATEAFHSVGIGRERLKKTRQSILKQTRHVSQTQMSTHRSSYCWSCQSLQQVQPHDSFARLTSSLLANC